MNCIHSYSSPLNLLTLQKQRHNSHRTTNLSWHFFGHSTNNNHAKTISKIGVFPLKMDVVDFSASLTLADIAVAAKPPNMQVLFQTSALMLFVYMVANFIVPQFLSESLGFDKVEENEQAKTSTYSEEEEEEKTSSATTKTGFNSTKPK